MPNIGAMLKQEIARLSRREVRSVTETTRKAAAQHRRHIAALRRQVARLERIVALLQRQRLGTSSAATPSGSGQKMRFVAKGLKSQRSRLGLSAADYGRLVGVTAQSVYNWERGNATPRGDQLARVAALRSIGKREAMARLEQAGAKKAKRSR
jgi:DNA-binding XRE family transcriptional regulator